MRLPLLASIVLCAAVLTACSSDDTNPIETDNNSNVDNTTQDDDGDGFANGVDNCPAVFNPMQTAVIGNVTLLGDMCDDEDADAIFDAVDNCPLESNFAQLDFDGNTVGDACEVCGALDENGNELNPSCNIPIVLSDPEYFKDVTLRSEFGTDINRIRKWRIDVNYFVSGEPGAQLRAELDRIVAELNSMIDVELIEVDNEADSNFHIFFGSGEDYAANIQPGAEALVEGNWGLFWAYWNDNYELIGASMYVDMFRTFGITDQSHLLREELTQALGMWNDTAKYPDSIFYSVYAYTTEYLEVDREIIRTLYNPRVKVGMTDADLDLLFLEQ